MVFYEEIFSFKEETNSNEYDTRLVHYRDIQEDVQRIRAVVALKNDN